MDELALAKSFPKEDIQTHTNGLLTNLELLKRLYPQINTDWELLYKACIYHDLGKMNEKFQNRIKTGKRYANELPHGLLSIAFINHKELREEGFEKNKIKILYQAVAYHHERDMPFQNSDIESEFPELEKQFSHFQYERLPNKFFAKYIDQRYFCVNERVYEEQGDIFFQFIMLKGLLNRLDYAASANIPVENPNDFLEKAMSDLIERWQKNDSKVSWNDLQKYMLRNKNRNVVVIAQTGMGKTEAGLLWLGNEKGFFTLPLKSAINAIYSRVTQGIVLQQRENRIGMLHSDTFINYLENTKYDTVDNDLSISALDNYYLKTKQLSLPLTICTLDQLFTFVFRYRGFEQKLATLSYSKVIVDEVQMYSPELVAFLVLGLHYINKMGGRFSILTATLPTFFIDLLYELKIDFEEPQTFTNEMIRHSLKIIDGEINSTDIIDFIKTFKGRKILIICNTIKVALSIYKQFKETNEEVSINLLHSHFTKADRKIKESQILKMGQKESNENCIWVTTQIVEASLDIDFDLLFTELSDLNGLFQRMGRCYRNRNLNKQYNCFVFTGGRKTCSGVGFFIDKNIYELSKDALKSVDGVINEKQKVDMVKKLYTKENLPEYYNMILDNIHYVKSCQDYELNKIEASNRFRNISNISIIPRTVFEKNKTKILGALSTLRINNKEGNKEEIKVCKAIARSIISESTVDVEMYLARQFEQQRIKINDFEQIIIAECEYSSEEGLNPVKISKIDDFSSHVF